MHQMRGSESIGFVRRRCESAAIWLLIALPFLIEAIAAGDDPAAKPTRGDETIAKEVSPRLRFDNLDSDRDGQLSETEFLWGAADARTAKRDFKLFDLNEDGQLSYEELLLSPDLTPFDQRGRLPDPVVARVEQRLAEIEAHWKDWDRNGDGQLGKDEFTASMLTRSIPGLSSSGWDDWDLDRSGGISRDECRKVLEVAYGVIRPDGQPLRNIRGQVLQAFAFQSLDRNHDDRLDHDEYVKSGFDGELAEGRFKAADTDQDGFLSIREWAALPYRWTDPMKDFRQMDKNLDGQLDREELVSGAPVWLKPIAARLLPGFDVNADGRLSLPEYQFTPLVNQLAGWHVLLQDRNHDGLLNRDEFRWEAGLPLAALLDEYFDLFDSDHNGHLELAEFSFRTLRRDPQREFHNFDLDEDGRLNEVELGIATGNKPQIERRLLKLFDFDGDRQLSYDEFLTVPGLVPKQMRGRLPDPIVKLVETEMARIDSKWSVWDRDGDQALNRDEFQASGLGRFVRGLLLSTWKDWDRDGNGKISHEDCRQLLEIAFGVRRLTGEPLRYESGITVNWAFFGNIDRNHNGRLDLDEFIKHGMQGELSETRFRETDANHDQTITFAEWSKVDYWLNDPIADFLWMDTDFDGQLDRVELLNGAPQWQRRVAQFLFPGFDLDRDGFMSLEEYRRTPLANHFANWNELRRDSDNDGRLSAGDFQWGRHPELAGLEAEYFRCLDVNHDNSLDLTEFFFYIDPAKAPPEAIFAQRDRDADGRLSFDEVLGDFKSAEGAKPDEAYELRLARIEEAFRKADADHDQFLTLDEFRSPAGIEAIDPDVALRRIAATAASTGIPASGADAGGRGRMWLIVGVNGLMLLAAFAYVTFIKK